MKVLLVNSLYYPNIVGGAEKSIQILAENFQVQGTDVRVVCIHSTKDSTGFHNGVKIYYLHHRNFYHRFQDLPKYKRLLKPLHYLLDTYNPIMGSALEEIIKIEEPKIVHTNNLYGLSPIIWQIARRRKINVIHTIRDHQMICARGHMYRKNKLCKHQCFTCRLLTLSRKEMSENVDVAIGISNYILENHLKKGIFQSCLHSEVIFNPIVSSSPVIPKMKVNKPIRFLYLGGIFEAKGFNLLKNTFSKLTHYNGEWELWVAGPGEIKAKHKGNIQFLGVVDSKYLYPQVDVVIVPSLLNEAFGRVIVEANSFGLPVIGTNRGGIPELIKHGETGYIFDPNIEDDFLNQLKRFIENPSLILHLSPGCLTHSHEFKVERIVDQYRRIYNYFSR